jgi:hypothetical protein
MSKYTPSTTIIKINLKYKTKKIKIQVGKSMKIFKNISKESKSLE